MCCPGRSALPLSLFQGWGTVCPESLLVTLEITFMALLAAVVGGGGLAILFAQSKWVEASLFPYAVILQVTPIVAIAPLILIYVRNTRAGAADLRLAGGVLPDPVEHLAGAELRRIPTSSI